jgi:hypothetical protein
VNRFNRNQVVLSSKIRTSASGVEMLDFTLPLGVLELRVSVAIPEEGTNEAPVYVHIIPMPVNGDRKPRSMRPGRDIIEDQPEEGNRR